MNAYRDQYATLFTGGRTSFCWRSARTRPRPSPPGPRMQATRSRSCRIPPATPASSMARGNPISSWTTSLFVIGPDGKVAYKATPFRESILRRTNSSAPPSRQRRPGRSRRIESPDPLGAQRRFEDPGIASREGSISIGRLAPGGGGSVSRWYCSSIARILEHVPGQHRDHPIRRPDVPAATSRDPGHARGTRRLASHARGIHAAFASRSPRRSRPARRRWSRGWPSPLCRRRRDRRCGSRWRSSPRSPVPLGEALREAPRERRGSRRLNRGQPRHPLDEAPAVRLAQRFAERRGVAEVAGGEHDPVGRRPSPAAAASPGRSFSGPRPGTD